MCGMVPSCRRKNRLNVLQHNVHDFLAYLICSLHRFCFGIDADDGLGVGFAEVYPLVRKVNLYAVDVVDFGAGCPVYIAFTFSRMASTSVEASRSIRFLAMA